jgi:hypothetical protein
MDADYNQAISYLMVEYKQMPPTLIEIRSDPRGSKQIAPGWLSAGVGLRPGRPCGPSAGTIMLRAAVLVQEVESASPKLALRPYAALRGAPILLDFLFFLGACGA